MDNFGKKSFKVIDFLVDNYSEHEKDFGGRMNGVGQSVMLIEVHHMGGKLVGGGERPGLALQNDSMS